MSTTIRTDTRLYNRDLSPESASGTWKTINLVNWWMSGWHSLGGYTMAVGLFALGLSGWQMMLAFLLGVIVLNVINNISGVAGQRAKVPFPVLARASFGVFGANIPALLRAVVAVCWYGIQTYLASAAVMLLLLKLNPGLSSLTESSFAGLSTLGWICFLGLSLLQIGALTLGMESVRRLSDFAGPTIWIAMIFLAVWVLSRAGWSIDLNYRVVDGGSVGAQTFAIISAAFIVIAYLAGPSLNFADFTRNAPSEQAVKKGNALGLLINGTAFGVISIVIALASVKVYGQPISDPVALLQEMDSISVLLIAIIAITIATAGVNIIMNFVAPAYDILNVWPQLFTFKKAGILVAVLAVAITPWNLYANPVIVNQFIGGVGALMGPLFGVIMTDFYIVQRGRISTPELFNPEPGGRYHYRNGVNPKAVWSLVIAGLISISIAMIPLFSAFAAFAWPVGVLLGAGVYYALNQSTVTAHAADPTN